MLDQLFTFILDCLGMFRFWIVLDPYEQGVLLRLGKFVKVLEPGFHWILPFHIDTTPCLHVVPSTHSLGNESIISKDGRAIGFHSIITFKVSDIRKALLEVADVDHAVRDACSGEVGRVLHESTFDEIMDGGIIDKMTAACRKRGWRFGIEIIQVQLAGLCIAKSVRLMQSK